MPAAAIKNLGFRSNCATRGGIDCVRDALENRAGPLRLAIADVGGGTTVATGAEVAALGEVVAPTATGVPHLLQNFTPLGSCRPHFVQKRGAGPVVIALFLRAPHFVQNGPGSVRAAPHCAQTSAIDSSKPPSQAPLARVSVFMDTALDLQQALHRHGVEVDVFSQFHQSVDNSREDFLT